MVAIELTLRELLEQRQKKHDASIAATVELHGHMVNPLSLRPISVKALPLSYPAGASDRKLDAFERRRGFQLPHSLRHWLKITNGAAGFFGVRPKRSADDLEREMDFWPNWGYNEGLWRADPMVYHGIVTKGQVVLEGNPALPEGAEVRLELVEKQPVVSDDDPIYRIGDLALPTGIPDLAKNIDYYLYGHPKVGDDR